MSAYRKWGRTIRYENGTVVRVEEAGEAVERDGEFLAYPIRGRPGFSPALTLAGLKPGVPTERIVLSEGVAIHETSGLTWTEHTRRLQVVAIPAERRVGVADEDKCAGPTSEQADGLDEVPDVPVRRWWIRCRDAARPRSLQLDHQQPGRRPAAPQQPAADVGQQTRPECGAAFNERALKACRKAGFVPRRTFHRPSDDRPFVILTRDGGEESD